MYGHEQDPNLARLTESELDYLRQRERERAALVELMELEDELGEE